MSTVRVVVLSEYMTPPCDVIAVDYYIVEDDSILSTIEYPLKYANPPDVPAIYVLKTELLALNV